MPRLSALAPAALVTVAAAHFAWVVNLVARSFYRIPHWDYWEFFRAVLLPPGWSLKFLFAQSNEHIIASSKVLFLLDLYLFGATSWFLVASFIAINLLVAWLLAVMTFDDWPRRAIAFAAFSAAAVSLAQWENLLWAFQIEFPLVALGAALSIYALGDFLERRSATWFIAFAAALFLVVFSLGNGICIIVALLVLLVGTRQPARIWLLVLFPYLVLAAVFFAFGGGANSVGNPELRTAANIVPFFCAVIGGPFTSNQTAATEIGAGFIIGYAVFCLWTVALPLVRREAIDLRLLQLVALGCFLLASVAAITYSRVTLGPIAALAPRYATPMLLLWMAGFAALARAMPWRSASVAIVVVAMALGLDSSLRTDNLTRLNEAATRINGAAAKIAAGDWSDNTIKVVHYDPSRIRPLLVYMRDHRLSVFR